MSVRRFLLVYAVTLPIFFGIDLVWLGLVANAFYPHHLGHLLSAQVQWIPAILFYLLYIAGIVYFAVKPAIEAGRAGRALVNGAFLGLVAYATYDLTNQATMRDWPVIVTVVDLMWGSVLTGSVAVASYLISRRVG
jgi:uncharacterized membrane protein